MSDEPRSNIVQLVTPVGDGYESDVSAVLDSAKGQLVEAVVIGRDKHGHMTLFHTTGAAKTLYLLALAQHTILSATDED